DERQDQCDQAEQRRDASGDPSHDRVTATLLAARLGLAELALRRPTEAARLPRGRADALLRLTETTLRRLALSRAESTGLPGSAAALLALVRAETTRLLPRCTEALLTLVGGQAGLPLRSTVARGVHRARVVRGARRRGVRDGSRRLLVRRNQRCRLRTRPLLLRLLAGLGRLDDLRR